MREIRQSGSEGGGAESNRPSLPLSGKRPLAARLESVFVTVDQNASGQDRVGPVENSQDQPWYREGLKFTCSQCGDCCTGPPGVVWVTEAEIEAIAAHLQKSVAEIRLFHTRRVRGRVSLTEYPSGDCTFFDPATRHCRVYQSRPVQCRTWPFWNSHLVNPEAWNRVCEVCPGAGTGAFFSLEQIQERARQIDM